MKPRFIIWVAGLALLFCSWITSAQTNSATLKRKGPKTVEERIAQYGPKVHSRLAPRFKELGIPYPPKRLTLIGLKEERVLEVWVSKDEKSNFLWLTNYPILASSGETGPKLRQGDGQVPEGIYKIEAINPNSLYHLSLRVNYPNPYDRAKAKIDGRNQLGSDIMIHGNEVSIGCLAMGDPASEDLFVLAAETGIKNINVILCPIDFRTKHFTQSLPPLPSWTPELYSNIQTALIPFKIRQTNTLVRIKK